MKPVQFPGLNGPHECHYAIGQYEGSTTIIFVQGPTATTSVTNAIEEIVNLVLPVEFPGLKPHRLRYFLHYPSPDGLAEWQEVIFEVVQEIKRKDAGQSWLGELWREVRGAPKNASVGWHVASPVWEPPVVTGDATKVLAGILTRT